MSTKAQQQRQKNLLIVLGILILFAAWRYIPPMLGLGGDDEAAAPVAARPAVDSEGDEVSARPTLPGAANGEERIGARPGDRVAVLRLQDLERVPRVSPAGRDPWRFVDPPPPPAPKPPPGPTAEQLRQMEEARRRAEEAARLAAAAAAAEAAKPRPAEFTLEYLGRFGSPETRIAVFSDGKTVFNKQEGEVIDNKFIVARIGYESVDIRFVGFPDWPAKRVGVRRR